MTREEIVRGLRCSATCGEPLDCTGCPYLLEDKDEDGVRIQDCNADRIFENAADLLENDRSQILALQRELELKRAQLDCASASAEKLRRQNRELRDAAALVTRLAGDAAAERDWISVEDRLPEVWRNDETAELVNYMIYSPDFGVDIGNYHATVKKWFGMALPCTVTHWAPLPEPPKEEPLG